MYLVADPTKALTQAVVIQARNDALEGDVTALEWLSSEETADTFLFVADLRYSVVLMWCLRIIRAWRCVLIAEELKNDRLQSA